jgi:hypothetical protein
MIAHRGRLRGCYSTVALLPGQPSTQGQESKPSPGASRGRSRALRRPAAWSARFSDHLVAPIPMLASGSGGNGTGPFGPSPIRGPVGFSVVVAVGQAGVDEAAVAAGRGPTDAVGLDENDASMRVALCRMQSGPEPGVAAADDQQVAADRSCQRRVLRPWHVEPHRAEGACCKRAFDHAGINVCIEHLFHTAVTTRCGQRTAAGRPPVNRASTGPTMARMNTYGVATASTASIDVPTRPMMTNENSPRAISAVPARS